MFQPASCRDLVFWISLPCAMALLLHVAPSCTSNTASEVEPSLLTLLQAPQADSSVETPPGSGVVVPSGQPAAPGEPHNAPDLVGFQVQGLDFGEYGATFLAKDIAFSEPVHSGTVIAAFIGGKGMALQSDHTVVNSMMHWTFTAGQLAEATGPPSFPGSNFGDRKLRILVVARNEFGVSTRELPARRARVCAAALQAPATFGDCGSHCITATLEGAKLALKARRVVTPLSSNYLFLDIATWLPPHWLTLAGYNSMEEDDGAGGLCSEPIPEGAYEVTNSFDIGDNENMCIWVDSFSIAQAAGSDPVTVTKHGIVLVP